MTSLYLLPPKAAGNCQGPRFEKFSRAEGTESSTPFRSVLNKFTSNHTFDGSSSFSLSGSAAGLFASLLEEGTVSETSLSPPASFSSSSILSSILLEIAILTFFFRLTFSDFPSSSLPSFFLLFRLILSFGSSSSKSSFGSSPSLFTRFRFFTFRFFGLTSSSSSTALSSTSATLDARLILIRGFLMPPSLSSSAPRASSSPAESESVASASDSRLRRLFLFLGVSSSFSSCFVLRFRLFFFSVVVPSFLAATSASSVTSSTDPSSARNKLFFIAASRKIPGLIKACCLTSCTMSESGELN
mmetsp:Transcript_9044/g.12876  ORF Transcript_9044/g.12876 Transcript_9044/m.12876 type:complete len:301 (-) Transcript_9044:4140-5042(-)